MSLGQKLDIIIMILKNYFLSYDLMMFYIKIACSIEKLWPVEILFYDWLICTGGSCILSCKMCIIKIPFRMSGHII